MTLFGSGDGSIAPSVPISLQNLPQVLRGSDTFQSEADGEGRGWSAATRRPGPLRCTDGLEKTKMRQQLALAVTTVCVVTAACSGSNHASTPTTASTPAPTAALVAPTALDGLLLTIAEVSDAMGGVPGLSVQGDTYQDMIPSSEGEDQNCGIFMDGPAMKDAYADSGSTDSRLQVVSDGASASNGANNIAMQAVVRLPSVQKAAEFYDVSVRAWSACSNRSYTSPQGVATGLAR
jgi:hypothetical protein